MNYIYTKIDDGKIKLLVLIIDSDDFPVYAKLREIWRSYMHIDPEHIAAYFIRGNENLTTQTVLIGDTIWSKTKEGWTPASPGILNKTILSMEFALSQTKHFDFDYILRTDLSSFFIFPRLLNFLSNCPREKFYCGGFVWSNGKIIGSENATFAT
jgi:hypothetical protein